MTTPSDLRERVARAAYVQAPHKRLSCGAAKATPIPFDDPGVSRALFYNIADAAIAIVVAACAEVCHRQMLHENEIASDPTNREYAIRHGYAASSAGICEANVRNLLPTPKDKP